MAELGAPVVELLAPQPGERILDLGCGDGVLTARLAELGCSVVGRGRRARHGARGPSARARCPRRRRPPPGVRSSEFDAVFSNAALHWMKADPDAVIAGVAGSLRPGGRFVGEMGGHGNVAAIVVAMLAVLTRRGLDGAAALPWYFPTPDGYRARLERQGFAVERIELLPRPTPLCRPAWRRGSRRLPGRSGHACPRLTDRRCAAEAVELLRPALCDAEGAWTADYVRLRFAAVLQPKLDKID